MDVLLGMACLGFPVLAFTGWAVWWLFSRLRNKPADSFMIERGDEYEA